MKFYSYKIYYEDTDAQGIVYYANYLRFFERARTDFLLEHCISQKNMWQDGIFFVIRSCNIEYISTATLEDILAITCVPRSISYASISFEQEAFINNKLVTRGIIDVACVTKKDEKFILCQIPGYIKAKVILQQ